MNMLDKRLDQEFENLEAKLVAKCKQYMQTTLNSEEFKILMQEEFSQSIISYQDQLMVKKVQDFENYINKATQDMMLVYNILFFTF